MAARDIARVIDSFNGVPCTYVRPDAAPVRPGEPCGEIHTRCIGHLSARKDEDHRLYQRIGDPCTMPALKGQCVCRLHGGKAKQNLAKGAERVADEQAAAALTKVLGEVDAREIRDPSRALAQLAGEIQQAKDAARHLMRHADNLVDTPTGGMDVHPYVKLYERLVGQYRGILVDMGKLDIDERIANVEELTLSMQMAAIVAGLADAGVDTPEVRKAIAARFQALELEAGE